MSLREWMRGRRQPGAALPVMRHEQRIVDDLRAHQVLVVESPTGSGKTTLIPLILWRAGFGSGGVIGVTQPRRIATVSVAAYMQRQLGDEGKRVAYKMRFEDTTTPDTDIKIMTDGTLLQEMKHDPLLSAYKVLIIDEAHERSLNIDFILGLVKRLVNMRRDLKVVISSATINTAVFLNYFKNSALLSIDAPSFPVQVRYTPVAAMAEPEVLIEKIVDIVGAHAMTRTYYRHAILIFLSGEAQIRDTLHALDRSSYGQRLHLLPLFGRLSSVEQDRVFDAAPSKKMKIIAATNIAETSITINDITIVIDSGRAKINYFIPRSSTSRLDEQPISTSSANQRKGRAGRTAPGLCYRLYSEPEYTKRPQYTTEEIFRTDLSEVVLRMAELGIRDYTRFDFISSPGRARIAAAIAALQRIDVLDNNNELTALGKEMAPYPLYPKHARIILEAIRHYPTVVAECICAVSFLTTSSPFIAVDKEEIENARAAQRQLASAHGDFDVFLRILKEYSSAKNKLAYCQRYYLDPKALAEIYHINEQLTDIVSRQGIPVLSSGPRSEYLAALARGLVDTILVHSGGGRYRSLTLSQVILHPGSLLFGERPQMIIAGEIVKTTRTYARTASPIKAQWLTNFPPDLLRDVRQLEREGRSSHNRRGDRGRPTERATGGRSGTRRGEHGGARRDGSTERPSGGRGGRATGERDGAHRGGSTERPSGGRRGRAPGREAGERESRSTGGRDGARRGGSTDERGGRATGGRDSKRTDERDGARRGRHSGGRRARGPHKNAH